MDFSGGLIFPVTAMLKRPLKFNRPGAWAIIDTGTAIPAFFRVQDDGRLTFDRIGNIDVNLADLDAVIAAVAFIGKKHRIVRGLGVRYRFYFFCSHYHLLK